MHKTQVRSLGQEDPLEEEVTTHSSILAWEIPWTEEPGRLQSMGLYRVRHSWSTNTHYEHVARRICFVWFLLIYFFLTWTIFKVFIEFVTILLLFYILVFGSCSMWDLSFPTSDQTCTPCIGRGVLATGPPGKSLLCFYTVTVSEMRIWVSSMHSFITCVIHLV